MHSQLGYTFTVWRWFVAIVCISAGIAMLSIGSKDAWAPPAFLLLGAGLVGLEVHLRRSRKTLVLKGGNVDVLQRGVSLGSVPVEFVQYWDRASRVRLLLKSLLVSFVCFFVFGTTFFFLADRQIGAVLISVGMIVTAASIWEFRTLWEIALPKPEDGYTTMELRKPGEAKPIVLTHASSTRVILLTKPDVVKLLGFWPADARKRSAGQR